MSASFESGTGVLSSPLTLSPILELLQVPQAQKVNTHLSQYEWSHSISMGSSSTESSLLTNDCLDLNANWMYTAIIQAVLVGPAPTGSKDDWSFVPISLTPRDLIPALKAINISGYAGASANLTVQTSAIRARLQCDVIDLAGNASNWIERYNSTVNSTGLESYYRLDNTLFQASYANFRT